MLCLSTAFPIFVFYFLSQYYFILFIVLCRRSEVEVLRTMIRSGYTLLLSVCLFLPAFSSVLEFLDHIVLGLQIIVH